MNILSNISERLKDLMTEEEIKIKTLATRTGVSSAVYSRILAGKRMPSLKTLLIIADYFHCSTDYVVGTTDNLCEKTFEKCPPFSDRLTYLLKYFKVSKYKLEKETGISEETVTRWQKGRYEPSVENLIKLKKFFDCSIDFILGREN